MSFVLLKPLGIAGVMIGNVVGIMAIPYWVQPYLVYDEVFKKSVKAYHIKFTLYTALTVLYAFLCYQVGAWACMGNFTNSIACLLSFIKIPYATFETYVLIAQIVFNMFVCVLIPNLLNIIIFFRTKEFKDLWRVTKSVLRRSKKQ